MFQDLFEKNFNLINKDVNDVIITQTPTIFVPLPSSTNQHQEYNANFLVEKKAALYIEEQYLNKNESLSTLINLIENINIRNKIIKNLQKIKRLDSNQIIYENIND